MNAQADGAGMLEEIVPRVGDEFEFTSLEEWQRTNRRANDAGLEGYVKNMSAGPDNRPFRVSGVWVESVMPAENGGHLVINDDKCPTCGGQMAYVKDDRPGRETGKTFMVCLVCEPDALDDDDLDPLEQAHAESVALERQVDEEAARHLSTPRDERGLHRDPPQSERSRALMILAEAGVTAEIDALVDQINSTAIGSLVDEIESNVPAFALRFLNLQAAVRRQADAIQSIELFLGGSIV